MQDLYAVCEVLAFAVHVQPRATVEMDFVIRQEDLARIGGLL